MFYFTDFQCVIEFSCSASPVIFLAVFIINILFGIFSDMENFGGDK